MTPSPWLRALAACAVWLVPLSTRAHDENGKDNHDRPPVKVADAEAHRPSAIPDRIILTWTGDTARTQAVTWRTDASVAKAFAQIALATAAPKFVDAAKDVPAITQALVTDLGPARFHSAVFTGLEPATLYGYRVGDGVNWSEWFHFRTAAATPEPFTFIYFGDAQNDIKSLWSRVIRGAFTEVPRARFIVHAGDLINRGTSDAEWGEWHAAGGWVNGMVPSVPTPGNHEYTLSKAERDAQFLVWEEAHAQALAAAKNAGKEPSPELIAEKFVPRAPLSPHWRPQFALPENGPRGLEESAYFLDFQGTRIVSLNSNERLAEQVPWLESILAANPNKWTVVTFHHPVYSSAKGRDNTLLRQLWQPVFDRHRVDLVLQGHDHTYARSGLRVSDNLASGSNARDAASGTVYVVSVSGPKMYDLDREDWMKRAAEDTQLYQAITINGDRLTYQARTAIGDLYDAFELHKRAGQPNELVERVPATPESRRAKPPAAPKPAAAAR